MNPTWRKALLLVSHPELSTHSSMSQRFWSPDSHLQPALVFALLEYSLDQSDAKYPGYFIKSLFSYL